MIYPWLPRLAQEVSFLQRRSAGFGVGAVQLPGGHPWIKNPRPNTSQHVPTFRSFRGARLSNRIQRCLLFHLTAQAAQSSPLRDPLRWKSHGKICATFSVRSCMEAPLAPLAQPILPSDFCRLHGRLAKLRLSDLLFMSIRERLLTQRCCFFFPVIDVTVLMI